MISMLIYLSDKLSLFFSFLLLGWERNLFLSDEILNSCTWDMCLIEILKIKAIFAHGMLSVCSLTVNNYKIMRRLLEFVGIPTWGLDFINYSFSVSSIYVK